MMEDLHVQDDPAFVDKQNISLITEYSDDQCQMNPTTASLCYQSTSGTENNSSENDSQRVNSLKPSDARVKRKEFLATFAVRHPFLKRNVEIDLTTEEDKVGTPDDWFLKKFSHSTHMQQKSEPSKTLATTITESIKKGEMSSVSAREWIQKTLEEKLSARRRIEQAKRKEVYDRDNCLVSSSDEEEEEFTESENDSVSDDENGFKAGEASNRNDTQTSFIVDDVGKGCTRGPNKSRNVFIDDEAEESISSVSTVSKDEADDAVEIIKKDSFLTLEDGKSKEANVDSTPSSVSQLPGLLLPITASQFVLDTNVPSQEVNETIGENEPGECPESLYLSDGEKNPSANAEILALCSGDFSGQKLVVQDSQAEISVQRRDIANNCSEIRLPWINENDDEEFGLKRKRKKVVISDSDDDDAASPAVSSKLSQEINIRNPDQDSAAVEMGADQNAAEGYQSESFGDSDDEDEEVEDIDESRGQQDNHENDFNSSDDELAIYRRLKDEESVEAKLKPEKRNKKFRSEYIEEEASLSGDDVGSDIDEDEGPDEYEEEEGDKEDLPDEETIREDLHKQWLKQQQDEEDRRLMYWKDQLLTDGDLYSETDRTFRIKLRDETENNGTEVGENENCLSTKEDEDTEDEEVRKKHVEMVKWKIENRIDDSTDEIEHEDSQLLSAGVLALKTESSQGSNNSQLSNDKPISRNSLLRHRSSLSLIVNQNETTSLNSKRGLFVSKIQEEVHVEESTNKPELTRIQKKSFFNFVL